MPRRSRKRLPPDLSFCNVGFFPGGTRFHHFIVNGSCNYDLVFALISCCTVLSEGEILKLCSIHFWFPRVFPGSVPRKAFQVSFFLGWFVY